LVKIPRKVILAFAVVLLLLVALTFYLQYSAPQSNGPWVATTPYPLQVNGTPGVLGQSCVSSSSSLYCIGGEDASSEPHSTVYSAPITSSGLGNWTADPTSYPETIMFASCVTYSGYVYCVGGTHDGTGDDTTSSYFAPVEANSLGNWLATSPYPIATDSQSCTPSSGYIFCVGGENETSGTNATATNSNSAWYASLSPSGIGTWTRTTAYPGGVFFPGCSSLGGYVYCVAGQDSTPDVVSSTYYAAVSPQGLGPWTASTAYPVPVIAQSCVTAVTYLYCVGGIVSGGTSTSAVFYAGLSPSGIGSWQQAGSYPTGLATDCVASAADVYCVGGFDPSSGPMDGSYYAPISSNLTSSASA
jgi:hypothetical protein